MRTLSKYVIDDIGECDCVEDLNGASLSFDIVTARLIFALLAVNVAGAGINPAARLFKHA
jgi:hypothetical protein